MQPPVPQVVEVVAPVSKIVPQERIMQRFVEQIVEPPVPQVVEEVAPPLVYWLIMSISNG